MGERDGFELTGDFWAQFVARHWEREPGVLPGRFPGPILSLEETFTATRAAFAALQPDDPGDRPRCYVEGAEVTYGPLYARFIPQAADASLEGYERRLKAELNGRGFGVVVNAFHVHAPKLWYRLRGFFRGLYALTGLPASKTDPVLFLGNYPVTPFGVHTDAASIFTFCLGAQKRMLLWPRDGFESRGVAKMDTQLLASHEPYASAAIDQRMGPDDLMYWPSSHWHVGVSEGDLQATLGVGVYFSSPQHELLAPLMRIALQNQGAPVLGPLARPAGTGAVLGLPGPLKAALDSATQVVSSGALARELQAEWLRRLSSDGCLPPPQLEPVALGPKDRVQLADGGPVLHCELGDGLLIAANGQSWFLNAGDGRPFEPSAAAGLLGTLAELNRGERVRVSQAVRGDPAMAAQLHQLLVYLASAGALRRV